MGGPSAWEAGEGEEKVSYLKEMLTHQYSLYGFLGSLASGALLALPYGFDVAALPLIGYLATTALAALFVPSAPTFREKVDQRKRAERREKMRDYLQQELVRRAGADHPWWQAYWRMQERLESLRKIARNRKTSLTMRDVERLNDSSVDYLSLWLARVAMYERQQTVDQNALRRKLQAVQQQRERAQDNTERRRLDKAVADLEQVLARHERLVSKEAALEASMLAMSDAFEEIYQVVMTNPNSGDVTRQLEEAVERINFQEDLSSALDDDEGDLFRVRQAGQVRAKSM